MARSEDVLADLARVAQSLARSVEARNVPPEQHNLPVGELSRLQEAIDFIVKPLMSSRTSRYRFEPDYARYVLRDLAERLDQVRSDDILSRIGPVVEFKFYGAKSHRSADPVLHEGLLYGRLNVREALQLLSESVDTIIIDDIEPGDLQANATNIRALARILPEAQVPAPAQFSIDGDRIVIVTQASRPENEDVHNIQVASEEILRSGRNIINELSKSNCDRRLIEGVQELQAQLESQDNIIRTGITNITCAHLFQRFEKELPEAVYGMMQGHSVSVSMYVAQFPEWRRFANQASEANLDRDQAPAIAAAARKVVEYTANKPELADPEVPRLFKLLSELLADPNKATKRALFAVIRTIENLIHSAYSYAKDLLKKTADKTIDSISSAASKVIVIAAASGVLLSPVVASLPEVAWVQKATEIVIRELRGAGIDVGGHP